MSDPLKPKATLLVKLGSLAVHVEEMLSPKGHHFDKSVIDALLKDSELKTWIKQMSKLGFMPVKR